MNSVTPSYVTPFMVAPFIDLIPANTVRVLRIAQFRWLAVRRQFVVLGVRKVLYLEEHSKHTGVCTPCSNFLSPDLKTRALPNVTSVGLTMSPSPFSTRFLNAAPVCIRNAEYVASAVPPYALISRDVCVVICTS